MTPRPLRYGGFLLSFIVMNWLKNYLIEVRWGNTLTPQDRFLAAEMTFLQLFKSSYLLPKTLRVASSWTLRRR